MKYAFTYDVIIHLELRLRFLAGSELEVSSIEGDTGGRGKNTTGGSAGMEGAPGDKGGT